jgi:hypothetical protein
MSFHRSTLVAIATFFTVGMTSVAFAGCCDWGTPAPVVYAPSGCGGCGAAYAPIVYATPIAPAPITVGGCGGCGTPTAAFSFVQPVAPMPTIVGTWGGGCGGCGAPVVYTAPAPIYVVNQGPEYTGPGVMVPYRTYAPPAEYAPPPAYPPYIYHSHRYYPAPGPRVVYREHVYYHPHVYGPHYYGPRPYPRRRYWHG